MKQIKLNVAEVPRTKQEQVVYANYIRIHHPITSIFRFNNSLIKMNQVRIRYESYDN